MTMKILALSLTVAAGALLGGLGRAQAADIEAHPRLPHVTYGPAIPQYLPRYVVQQGLPDEGPLTLNDSPYSSAAYPVEYAAPGYGYDYVPVYGPFYGFGIPFAHRRHSFEHGVAVFRGGHAINAHRPGARMAAHRPMPHMMGRAGGRHR
jgi:hypothetical protein